jgi:hypothetical protein
MQCIEMRVVQANVEQTVLGTGSGAITSVYMYVPRASTFLFRFAGNLENTAGAVDFAVEDASSPGSVVTYASANPATSLTTPTMWSTVSDVLPAGRYTISAMLRAAAPVSTTVSGVLVVTSIS